MKLHSLVTIVVLLHSSNAEYADSSEELDAQATRNAYISSFVISPLSICHVVDSMLDLKYQSVNVSLAGMLGRSYDLLTDKSYYPILQESFTSCQKTPDSRFYIPNNYRVMFLMQRYIDMSAQLSTTFSEATESTTAGGTVSGGGTGKKFAGSGTGSANYQHTKKTMEQEGNAMYHMSVINKMYRLTGDMSAPFTKAFESRLKAVIDAIQKENALKARYLVERIISDFGTHVTMEALVGTHMEYRAYVKKSAVSVDESTKTSVSGQATAELQNAKGGGVGAFNKADNDRSSEESFSMNVEAFVVGGAELKKLNNPTEAFDDTYPVAISRSVYPIYMMMDSGNLEHLINNTIDMDIEAELRRHFEHATHEYFERNQINGCTNKNKINYDFQVCLELSFTFYTYTLGGIIQKCEPYPESDIYNSQWPLLKQHWNIKENRICPSNLVQTEIISFDYVLPDVHISNITELSFNDTSNNQTKRVEIHTDVVFRERVHLKTYWCGLEKGYASIGFGGYFDHNQVNNFIGERDCPSDTPKVTLFHGTTFCLTETIFGNTSELTLLYSNRNRIINCPHGHSKQLITVINFEKIYACILKRNAHYHLDTPAILKGPYLDKRYAMDLYDQDASCLNVLHLSCFQNFFNCILTVYCYVSSIKNSNFVINRGSKNPWFFAFLVQAL
uniref:Macrophage-expressed gene 1 protein n=1 Tax=Panagrellus redivivus TaxID=6233 RepID=A0A7E4UZK2_PANRE